MPGLSPPDALSAEAKAFLDDLERHGRAANTVAAYRRDLVAYERFLRGRRLTVGDAGEDDVETYVAELTAAGRRPASVARALVALRALHRWCGSDAAGQVGTPGPGPSTQAVLTEAEVVGLIDAAQGGSATARRDRALLEMLYATGARISEVVGLSLGDVGDGWATFGGRLGRRVPYGRPAADAVAAWRAPGGRDAMVAGSRSRGGDDGALFVNQRGGRLSRQWGWSVVRSYGDRVGVQERLGPNVLRHSLAAHLAGRGAPPGAVSQLLTGHPEALGPDELAERYRRWHPRA